jgi:hypothetical protein
MKKYKDNLIGKDKPSEMDIECRIQMKHAEGFLPFEAYDMVQCGYPYADHGEMILRSDGGINEKRELLPSKGMWCKVEDVLKVIDNVTNQIIEEMRNV